jgi:hypothetical protein
MVSVNDRAALIIGHPFIYARYHRPVDLWYVGWHVGGVDYAGSPDRAARRQLRQAYEAAGIPQGDGELIVLRCGPETVKRSPYEAAYITEFRKVYGTRRVVNRWPFLSDFIKYHWNHNHQTHVDSTVDCPYAVYHKRQSKRTTDGMCSNCALGGRHHCDAEWDDADPNTWCKVEWPDGTVLLLPQEDGNPYDRFRVHKDETLLAMGVIQ